MQLFMSAGDKAAFEGFNTSYVSTTSESLHTFVESYRCSIDKLDLANLTI